MKRRRSTRSQGILISASSSVLKDLTGNGEKAGGVHFESPSTYGGGRTRLAEEKSYDCNKTRTSELE